MLRPIARIALRLKIKRDNMRRQKKFVPWERIEKIALIIDNENGLNKSALDRFVEETKKYIQVFFVETRSKQPSYHDWTCFSKKDRSLLSLPTKRLESELRHKRFDVVINACAGNNLFSTSISSSLSADLKCGLTNDYDVSDLIVKRTDSFTLVDYLSEVVRYLKMIRV
jgi:hypothetical protein